MCSSSIGTATVYPFRACFPRPCRCPISDICSYLPRIALSTLFLAFLLSLRVEAPIAERPPAGHLVALRLSCLFPYYRLSDRTRRTSSVLPRHFSCRLAKLSDPERANMSSPVSDLSVLPAASNTASASSSLELFRGSIASARGFRLDGLPVLCLNLTLPLGSKDSVPAVG